MFWVISHSACSCVDCVYGVFESRIYIGKSLMISPGIFDDGNHNPGRESLRTIIELKENMKNNNDNK